MIKDLDELVKILDEKIKPMVAAIKDADPSKEEYGVLLSNFSLTMTLSSNINRTLMDVARRAQELAGKEGAKDESNN